MQQGTPSPALDGNAMRMRMRAPPETRTRILRIKSHAAGPIQLVGLVFRRRTPVDHRRVRLDVWGGQRELNPPRAVGSSRVTTWRDKPRVALTTVFTGGLEPPPSTSGEWRSIQLSYVNLRNWGLGGKASSGHLGG